MKKLFRNIFLFFIAFIGINLVIILPVKAEIINDCNDESVDCAFCVYQLGNTDGCYLNFSVTYKSDSTPLIYQLGDKIDNYTMEGEGISCKYDYKIFAKDAFLNGEDIKCPNLNTTVETKSSGTGNFEFNYKIKLDENGQTKAADNSVIKKRTENVTSTPNEKEKSLSYHYDVCGGFDIRIINGEAQIDKYNSSDDFTIGGYIDTSLFTNNACPVLYYQSFENQGCTITTKNAVGLGYSVADCDLKDENTGEHFKIESPDLNLNIPNIDNCNMLLGYPSQEGSPAYYLLKAFEVIKYVAIILLIVLSIMDFIGAMASQDKDALKKVTNKLIKRFILCVVIFLLPYIVGMILKYIANRQADICGIG